MKKAIVIGLLVILGAGFSVGAFMVVRNIVRAQHEQAVFEELEHLIGKDDEDDSYVSSPDGSGEDILKKYAALAAKNRDFFGWLKIGGTNINYPVMYSPDAPERYLHTDFYGDYSDSGTPFIDAGCNPDGNYLIIYSHHMNNGSMFGKLPEYAKESYEKSHSVISFDTLHEKRTYKVFAAFYSRVYPQGDETNFHYYDYKALSDPAVFDEYISNVKSLSEYDTGITPAYGDEILVLSTCNYHADNGRFVVVAKRIS